MYFRIYKWFTKEYYNRKLYNSLLIFNKQWKLTFMHKKGYDIGVKE